ncbi:MAG: lytic transglycosylase [Rhizobiaceae bacterium]|nr:lytic transglycosylase [Rhizobiaceae bacterium]
MISSAPFSLAARGIFVNRGMLSSVLARSMALGLAVCLSCLGDMAAARNADAATAAGCQLQVSDAAGWRDLAACEAEKAGLPPQIALAVIEIESNFNPAVKGAAGEIGLMQVMPPTARMLGFQGTDVQLADPASNIRLGVTYLARAHRLAGGDLCTTLMKYRAGHKQSRFSDLSVSYCLKARKILAREGFQVSGEIPPVNLGGTAVASKPAAKSPAGADGCSRRILVPGPLFRKCADVRSVSVTRLTVSHQRAE